MKSETEVGRSFQTISNQFKHLKQKNYGNNIPVFGKMILVSAVMSAYYLCFFATKLFTIITDFTFWERWF